MTNLGHRGLITPYWSDDVFRQPRRFSVYGREAAAYVQASAKGRRGRTSTAYQLPVTRRNSGGHFQKGVEGMKIFQKIFRFILQSIFVLLLMLAMILAFAPDFRFTSIVLLAIAFLVLPNTRDYLQKKYGFLFTAKELSAEFAILFVLLIFSIGFNGAGGKNSQLKEEFSKQREELVLRLQAGGSSQDFNEAISAARKYYIVADEEFQTLFDNAAQAEEKRLADIRKKNFEQNRKSIIGELSSFIKKNQWQEASNLYNQYSGIEDVEFNKLGAVVSEKMQAQAEADAQEQNRKAQADGILNEVRGFSMFLDEAEADFKSNKPSDADLEKIRKTTTLFSTLGQYLNNARQNKSVLSKDEIAYVKDIERRTIALQQKVLPGLRLAFQKRAGELLWEYDTYVTVSGDGNRVINFTAGAFASNANIKTAQEQLAETLSQLRFREVRYRWYMQADEYTYYKLDTSSDAKLGYFLYGRFQDMAAGF